MDRLSGTDAQVTPVVELMSDGGVAVAMSFGGKAKVNGALLTATGQLGLGDFGGRQDRAIGCTLSISPARV